MNFEKVFDKNGNFLIKGFDPYRYEEDSLLYVSFYNKIFNPWDDPYGSGSVNDEFWQGFKDYLIKSKFLWSCDAVQLYYAQEMGSNTKGSYPAIYMWR